VKIGLNHQNAASATFRQSGGEVHDDGRLSIVGQWTGDQNLLQFSSIRKRLQLHPKQAEPIGRRATGIGVENDPVFRANISILHGKLRESRSGSRGRRRSGRSGIARGGNTTRNGS
jgi:hypothetical protein